MSLDEALAVFNAARHASLSDEPWASRFDRLAQAAFKAAEHLIVYGSLSPGAPNHGRLAPLGGAWERGWVGGRNARDRLRVRGRAFPVSLLFRSPQGARG